MKIHRNSVPPSPLNMHQNFWLSKHFLQMTLSILIKGNPCYTDYNTTNYKKLLLRQVTSAYTNIHTQYPHQQIQPHSPSSHSDQQDLKSSLHHQYLAPCQTDQLFTTYTCISWLLCVLFDFCLLQQFFCVFIHDSSLCNNP